MVKWYSTDLIKEKWELRARNEALERETYQQSVIALEKLLKII